MKSTNELFGGKSAIAFRHEVDRRTFIRGAALIGVGGTLAVRLKSDPTAFAQGSVNDLEILNFALTLEYLEADFYRQGVEAAVLEGRELELVAPIAEHEQAHVDSITETVTALGGTPVAMPMFTYPEGTFTDRTMFLETAATFEELGVTAYQGQVANIESGDILAAAAAIAGMESRHAAILADLTGANPFVSAFESSATMEEVLASAMPFIAGGQ
ncbi:ferritin-like domain-containing protein [soil metagenome]